MMNLHFRKAQLSELHLIWNILQQAIKRRKDDGSNQWQDGYPNPEILQQDIKTSVGFVLTDKTNIIGYCAVLINDEPEYAKIEGKWLTNSDFVVFHRLAISENYLGQGFGKKIIQHVEEFALKNKIYSVKADTNFDNVSMIKIFEKLGYSFCGKVYFRESPRNAYEKIISKSQA